MGYIVEISESKVEHLADTVGKMLHYGGMAMHCIEEMRSEHGYMGERNDYMNRGGYPMGERGGYGHMGMREQEMPHHDGYDHMGERWEDPYFVGERRGRSAMTGRYIHRP